MGIWKDEVEKLKATWGQPQEDKPPTPPIAQSDTDWKAGVKPLRRPNTLAQSSPRTKGRSGSTAVPRAVTSRRRAASQAGRQAAVRGTWSSDGLPPAQAIEDTYGGSKPKRIVPATMAEAAQGPTFQSLTVRVVLTRASEFKEPDPWVDDGAALQAPGGGTGRVLAVRLGVDFGTAYTKVAISAAGKVFFVDWAGIRTSDKRYLLPGELSRCENGTTWPGRRPSASQTLCGLKLPFLAAGAAGRDAQIAGVAFLVWVIRYVRAWLYRHQTPLVEGRRLAWDINIGSPTVCWSSPGVSDLYWKLAEWAWQLSLRPAPLTLADAESIVGAGPPDFSTIGLDGCGVMPEFVAQIAGYVNSKQRKDGLHLLVDVGAGTIDVAAFNVHRPTRDARIGIPAFAGAVEPLGTHVLMASRLDRFGRGAEAWQDLDGIPSPEQLAAELGIDRGELLQVDKEFSQRVCRAVGKVLRDTKANKHPYAPEWKSGMRVFLAGGGSACRVYRDAVAQSVGSFGTQALFTPFPMLEQTWRDVGKEDFHRVSVAFGLTYDAESVGRMLRPQEVEDIPRHTEPVERPDRDELYPK